MAVSWVRISFPGQGTSGPGDMAVDWLTRGTEKSVHGVQLVPSFAGTDIECGHMSFGVVVLKSVLEPVSASTGEAV